MPPQQSVALPRRHSIETISTWALIITVAAALLIYIPYASLSVTATKAFVLATGTLVSLALYILARLGRGNVIFPPSALLLALWLPVAASVLSALFSGVPFNNALWGVALEPNTLGFLLSVTVLGTLSALTLRRPEQYRTFLRVAVYLFGVICLMQVAMLLLAQFVPGIPASFSLIGSFADLGSVVGLGVIGSLITVRFMALPQRTYRALLISGALGLFLLAVANSLLVWTLVALVALGLFVEAVMRRGSRSADSDLDEFASLDEAPLENDQGNHSLTLPLVVLAVSLFFLIGGTLSGAMADALNVNVLNVRPSWQSTITVAENTLSSAPLFGSGPGTFGNQWLKYRDASLNSTVFWDLDFSSGIGFIPTSFVTSGILGIIAWVAFLGLFIVLGLRMLLRFTPQDPFTRYAAIISFVGTIYLFTIAIFDLPGAVVLALAFIFAGLFISTMRFGSHSQQWGVIFARSPRLGFIIVFSLTILLLSSVVAGYMLAERAIATTKLLEAASALSSGDLEKAEKASASSISFAPSSEAYRLQASIANANLTKIVTSTTMEKTAAQQAYQQTLSAGINAAITSTKLNAGDYQNWVALGNLYAQAVPLGVSGAYESAKSAYDKAQELNPSNPQILYILAQLDIARNETASAQANLKKAIALKQDYTAAIFLLSQLEVRDGNVTDALASALAAAYFKPNDPSILFQVGVLYAAKGELDNAAAALSAAIAADPQFANARYFLSAVQAKKGDLTSALAEMQAISDMSPENATAVATQLADLKSGKNPFPVNLLSISAAPVQ